MATKKGKGRGGWVKTQSISSIYSKNTLAHVKEILYKSLAPKATATHVKLPEKFKLNTEPHVDVAIEEDMKQRYTRWRYTLHQMFIECQTVEQALSNPHVEVDVDDWKYLVELWQDESWKRNPKTGVLPSRIDTLKSSLDMMKKIRNGLMMMLKRLT
ncbi:hypothetical protein Dsin_003709 [Dipteronia sinensis]|uniref:Uncharacterized protein n=1 Tax=Dipteronia sinensis TaxID=43782 RepID=A0AAE0B9G1_9ROSI|nr:hypothetical protein Dsin_003709 [Dipteronia sinensis]